MVLLLSFGCDDGDGVDGAHARADTFLDEHPSGTAVVQVGIDRPPLDAAVGTTWGSTDLAGWFDPCGGPPATAFDAALRVGPGAFPWPYARQTSVGPVSACAWDRLATFPFEGPSRRGEEDLVVIRWRPGETGDGAVSHTEAPRALPAGALAQTPPYYRVGDGIDWGRVDVDGPVERVRIDEGAVRTGPLPDPEGWARALTCPGEGVDLVRVTLLFRNGDVDEVGTNPEKGCVETRAEESVEWFRAQKLDGERVDHLRRALVVLDVPVGTW